MREAMLAQTQCNKCSTITTRKKHKDTNIYAYVARLKTCLSLKLL